MSKKKAIKTKALPVPKTREEAEQLLGTIGYLQRRVDGIYAKASSQVDTIQPTAAADTKQLNEDIDAKFQALHAYAEAHRHELLEGDSKTVKLATGTLSWRRTPLAVKLTKIADVIEELKIRGLERFIRTIEEVDKEALLACYTNDNDPVIADCIPGIKFTSREEFVAKPTDASQEYVETVVTTKTRRAA